MKSETRPMALLPLVVADIYELAGRFRNEGETIAATVGQTQARWQVMSAASGAPLTVPQIARRLGVTRQNVQRIADVLVGENWATFETNPDHRNAPHLVLNARGQSALAQLGRAAAVSHAELGRRLAGVDVGAIHSGLRRLMEAMNDRETTATKRGTKS
jgi:DNA-binding MarR family transcriptional regulator